MDRLGELVHTLSLLLGVSAFLIYQKKKNSAVSPLRIANIAKRTKGYYLIKSFLDLHQLALFIGFYDKSKMY